MVRIRLLGPIELTHADGTSARSVLAQPRRVVLLANLALVDPGAFRTREELLSLFWPDSPHGRARNALRQALHKLRTALGADILDCGGDAMLRLDPEKVQCDVIDFRVAVGAGRVGEAVEIYRGELLDGLRDVGGVELEHWLELERARLRRAFGEAARARVGELESEGRGQEAIDLCRRWAETAPYDELRLRRLMELLVRQGNRAGALHAYERFSARVGEYLGTEPDSSTVALASELRSAEGAGIHPSSSAGTDADAPLPASGTRRAPPGDDGTPPGGGSAERPAGEVTAHAVAAPDGRRNAGGPDGTRWLGARLGGWRRWPLVALGALLVPSAAYLSGFGPGEATPDPVSARPLVVVRPLENQTGRDSLDIVGRVSAEAIALGVMGRLGAVDVMVSEAGSLPRPSNTLVVQGAYRLDGEDLAFTVTVAETDGSPLRSLGPTRGTAGDPRDALVGLSDQVSVVASDVFKAFEGRRVTASAAPVPSWDAWEAFGRGLRYAVGGEWTRALPEFEQATRIDPGFTHAYYQVALMRANRGEFRIADSLLRVVRTRRTDLDARQRLELDWMAAALANDRVERYRIQVELQALTGERASWQVAYELYGLGRPAETLEMLGGLDEETMARRGMHRLWTLQAMAYHRLGRYDEALDATRRGLDRFPGHLDLMAHEAAALGALGRGDEVLKVVAEAFALPTAVGSCCPARVALQGGAELAFHGDHEAARQVYELGAESHAGRASARVSERGRHAQLLLRAERWEEARRLFLSLSEERPEEAEYIGGLGIVAARMGAPDEARRMIRRLDPQHYYGMSRVEARLLQAQITAALGEREEALRLIRDASSAGLAHGAGSHAPEFAQLWSDPAFRFWLEPRR